MGSLPRHGERRGNPQFVAGDGVFARDTPNTRIPLPPVWSSGLARCVFGTWHVAAWILGAITRI